MLHAARQIAGKSPVNVKTVPSGDASRLATSAAGAKYGFVTMRMMDERLSDQLAKIRANHDVLIAEHRNLLNEYRKTIEHQPPLDRAGFRKYAEKLRAHLDALHQHHVAICRHHDELDAFHKSNK